MSASVNVPRPEVLSRLSASLDPINISSSAQVLQMSRQLINSQSEFQSFRLRDVKSGSLSELPNSEQDRPITISEGIKKKLPHVADWKGTLDVIADMPNVAEEQRSHLEE